jgi:hypothetical protein
VNATTPEFYEKVKAKVLDYYLNPPQTLGNTSYGQLADKSQGEEITHKTYNSIFAEKVGAELEAAGVNWSAKVDGAKTQIAVNKNDLEKLNTAAEKAKPPKPDKPENPAAVANTPAKPKGGRK